MSAIPPSPGKPSCLWPSQQLLPGYVFRSAWSILVIALFLLLSREGALGQTTNGLYYSINADSTIAITGFDFSATAVTIPGVIAGLPVTSLRSNAFYGGVNLVGVTLPDSITSIGEHAFDGCGSLNRITLSTNIANIGDFVFNGCGSLLGLTLPAGVTNVGISAFAGCSSLKSLILPSGVASIESFAFQHSGLTSITIPGGVTNIVNSASAGCHGLASIGPVAFVDCYDLSKVVFLGNTPKGDSTVFNGSPTTVFYLPGTTGWGPRYGGAPTAVWQLPTPVILSPQAITTNGFGFTISWATNATIVVEATESLMPANWFPVSTNSISYSAGSVAAFNGWAQFSDSGWTNHPSRSYRVRPQ